MNKLIKSVLIAAVVGLVGCQTTHEDGTTTGIGTLYDYVVGGEYKTPEEPKAKADDQETGLGVFFRFIASGDWKTAETTH